MPHAFKQLLERMAQERFPGPSTSFSVFHLLLALELISKRTLGRNALSEALSVGHGAIRTIIARLEDAGLVEISKAGCSLTEKGLRIWKESISVLKKTEIENNKLTLDRHNFAVLIRNGSDKVQTGIEQRDAAVKAGARNAITIRMKQGRLIIPSVSQDVGRDFSEAANQLTELLHPSDNDAIVIVGSDGAKKAELGALAAAWSLLD